VEGSSAEEAAFGASSPFGASYTLFAVKVFEELGLAGFSGGKLEIYRGIKTDLKNSALYRAVDGLKEDKLS
ncbi:MAG: hypothetical protein LUD27_01800, partial [Clostridia bacterium]|nr:hypothetical protein [Clostridia bacterium]